MDLHDREHNTVTVGDLDYRVVAESKVRWRVYDSSGRRSWVVFVPTANSYECGCTAHSHNEVCPYITAVRQVWRGRPAPGSLQVLARAGAWWDVYDPTIGETYSTHWNVRKQRYECDCEDMGVSTACKHIKAVVDDQQLELGRAEA